MAEGMGIFGEAAQAAAGMGIRISAEELAALASDRGMGEGVCFVNLSFHKTASVRFTRQREDSSRTSVALAPILSSPTTPRA